MPIDREKRDLLADIIYGYLTEDTIDPSFCGAVAKIAMESNDKTVEHVGGKLLLLHSKHEASDQNPTKQEWDYLNRLLLTLLSNAEIITTKHRQWHGSQVVAFMALGGLVLCYNWFGFGLQLLAAFLLLGLISILLSFWRRRSNPDTTLYDGSTDELPQDSWTLSFSVIL